MPPFAVEQVGALAAESRDVGLGEGEAPVAATPGHQCDSEAEGETVEEAEGPASRESGECGRPE